MKNFLNNFILYLDSPRRLLLILSIINFSLLVACGMYALGIFSQVDVDLSHTLAGGPAFGSPLDPVRGQGFIPQQPYIDGVRVKVRRYTGESHTPLKAELYRMVDRMPDGLPLAMGQVTTHHVQQKKDTVVDIPLRYNQLEPGQEYAIVLSQTKFQGSEYSWAVGNTLSQRNYKYGGSSQQRYGKKEKGKWCFEALGNAWLQTYYFPRLAPLTKIAIGVLFLSLMAGISIIVRKGMLQPKSTPGAIKITWFIPWFPILFSIWVVKRPLFASQEPLDILTLGLLFGFLLFTHWKNMHFMSFKEKRSLTFYYFLAVIALFWILLHFLAYRLFLPFNHWGFSSLAKVTQGLRILIVLLFIAAIDYDMFNFFKQKLIFLMKKVKIIFLKIPRKKYISVILYIVMILGMGLLFWQFRSYEDSPDGACYICYAHAYPPDFNPFRHFIPQLSMCYGYHFLKYVYTPRDVIALLSCVSGGISVWLLFLCAKLLWKERHNHFIFVLLCISQYGILQLFCGHIETYAQIYVGILIFVYTSILYLQRKISIKGPALAFGLAFLFHVSIIYIFPAFLYLSFIHIKERLNKKNWLRELITISFYATLPLLFICLIVSKGDPKIIYDMAMVNLKRYTHLMPFVRIWSSAHFSFLFNMFMLYSPILFLVSIYLLPTRFREISKDRIAIFLAIVAFFYICYPFTFVPGTALIQDDWDVASQSCLAYSFLGSYLFIKYASSRLKYYLAMVLIGVSLFHTAPEIISTHNNPFTRPDNLTYAAGNFYGQVRKRGETEEEFRIRLDENKWRAPK